MAVKLNKKHFKKVELLIKTKSELDSTSGCLNWKGKITKYGYGEFKIKNQRYRAHRAAIMAHSGIEATNLIACHRCGNRKCVNVDHIYLGTNKDNAEDSIRHGTFYRQRMGEDNPASVLTNQEVIEIKKLLAIGNLLQKEIGNLYGVNQQRISDISTGKNWKSVGIHTCSSLCPCHEGKEPLKDFVGE